MIRRIHTHNLHRGEVALTPEQTHHLRNVLRLADGEQVEVFDDAGHIAAGLLRYKGTTEGCIDVAEVTKPVAKTFSLTIASAIPKGERADWMIEKLSELGVDTFIPLAAARSVVLPEGRNKHARWMRIATESAKQSRRVGTMQVGRLTPVDSAIKQLSGVGWVCSTTGDVVSVDRAIRQRPPALTVFIGPEGGWTEEELARFANSEIRSVGLTPTVLRVETAAIATAAVILTNRHPLGLVESRQNLTGDADN